MNSGLHLSSQDELNLQPGASHHLLLFTIPTSSEDIGVISASRFPTVWVFQRKQVQLLVMTPSQAR